ncbi:unnamed protein product [Bursaphelenchus okinawaensis]|uniref:Uncharacterized protein n=1 Tax=Bursaphelenchus okinawaensis TaxID=465554 RepID=A0A811K3A2_9BILA|nr:unnamed protein product [Bursaphelenchus okinawaensis]CAG9090792.1 unnamed protein product [Bursaphelenchus okinawaensis]
MFRLLFVVLLFALVSADGIGDGAGIRKDEGIGQGVVKDQVGQGAQIGQGSAVGSGVGEGAQVGQRADVQTGSDVGGGAKIGQGSTVGSGVGQGAQVGSGVGQGTQIGQGAGQKSSGGLGILQEPSVGNGAEVSTGIGQKIGSDGIGNGARIKPIDQGIGGGMGVLPSNGIGQSVGKKAGDLGQGVRQRRFLFAPYSIHCNHNLGPRVCYRTYEDGEFSQVPKDSAAGELKDQTRGLL